MTDGQAWTPNIYLKSFDLDSVQVGKAVFVKESYTTRGIDQEDYTCIEPASAGAGVDTTVCFFF